MKLLRLTTVRKCRALTAMGWGLLIMSVSVISLFLILFAYPFLAPMHPVDGEVLVVEGWLPDYSLTKVKTRFQKGNYKLLITTGATFTIGHPLSKYYKSWANLAASALNAKGIPLEQIILAPTSANPKNNRTYHTALEVKQKLSAKGLSLTSIDVVSLGPHSRRTWFMFKQVFPMVKVGIVSMEPQDYDVTKWWSSSAGLRALITESLAYFYARLIFSPAI